MKMMGQLYLVSAVRQSIRLFFSRKVSWKIKLIPIIALLYTLSPIDIIPDVFVGLGWLDDVGILLIALKLFSTLGLLSEQSTTANTRTEYFKNAPVIEEGEFEEIAS